MFFFYDDPEKATRPGKPFSIGGLDPVEMFARHYANFLELSWFAQHPDATFEEKAQARKELVICERKMTFWKNKDGFDVDRATAKTEALKKKWK